MSLYKMVLRKLKTVRIIKSFQALREERGAIFVLTAILLPVLLGGMGFAYDVGNLYMHKARLQNVADAASLAGARAFVDEAATQRKTLRTQYMNNNNVTTIPSDISAEINNTVKDEAKTAAKTAAVASVNQNIVNLYNKNYQSAYSLITGNITELNKVYEQQYFKANLRETVPLYFLPVLLDKREQEVAAEAISTIINKGTGNGGNNNQRKKFGPESLFMVKDGFSMEGDGFYNDGAGNTNNTPKKAPTWNNDYFEGDLRYTGTSVNAFFGNKSNLYSGDVPFDRVFNKKATELMTALKRLMQGYNQAEYDKFIVELQKHPDFYSDGAYTEKGRALVAKMEAMKPGSGVQYDHAFWGAYGAFYEELASNANYYRKFEKLNNYDMDQFGDAIKALFKTKLQQESNQTEEEINNKLTAALATWQTQENDWQTKHSKWLEDKAKAEEDAAQEIARLEQEAQQGDNSGESEPRSPQQVADFLRPYYQMYGGDGTKRQEVLDKYLADGGFPLTNNEVIFQFVEPQASWTTWDNWGWSIPGIDWRWVNIGNDYLKFVAEGHSLPGGTSIPTLEQMMNQWLQNNPEPQEPRKPKREDFIVGSNGDEYYAQYHGSSYEFTASGISKIPPSKEHSYFYHPAADGFGGGFTLTIDSEGFYTDDKITTETPFYLFIGDALTASEIKIDLKADVNRPLIFCYMGNQNAQIHIQLNGHTFQGIIYTPNSYGSEVHMNVNGDSGNVGTFKGTWMSKEIMLKQASSHFEYEEYYLDPSLQKAMPDYDATQQEDYSGGDDTVDEDLSDKNPIKVIKLVKSVSNIISEEPID